MRDPQRSWLKAAVHLITWSIVLCLCVEGQQPAINPDPGLPLAASLSEKQPHPNEKYFLQHLAVDQNPGHHDESSEQCNRKDNRTIYRQPSG